MRLSALLVATTLSLALAAPKKCPSKPPKPSPGGGSGPSGQECKCMPNDSCWPNKGQWTSLNARVGGRLQAAGLPLASVCHDPTYDEAACNALKVEFPNADFFNDKIFSPHNLRYTNYTCSPWSPREQPCTTETYAAYAILAEKWQDIAEGIKFAKKHNLRLVIRNTGHDFLGKSHGAGSLTISTRNFQSVQHIEKFTGPTYTGPAFKLGAAITVRQAYEAAGAKGLEVIGGECPSVGLAGGYIQGGGHSPLSGIHGMGADQALEFEVVLADGRYVKANPTTNKDLFWALSGGGAGTYGVVVSVTVKAFKSGLISAVQLTVPVALEQADTLFELVDFYHSEVPKYIEKGVYSYPLYGNFGTSYMFMLQPFFAPRLSIAEVDELLAPLRAKIVELGLFAVADVGKEYPDFWSAFQDGLFPNERSSNAQAGGRLIPLQDLVNNRDEVNAAFRTAVEAGALAVEFAVNPNLEVAGNPDNSVNPVWRETAVHFIAGISYPENPTPADIADIDNRVTNIIDKAFEAATPNGGVYGNEGDANNKNWQQNFYGVHYEKLLSLKNKYDPDTVFWVKTGVGSEGWDLVDGPGGRLCRV